MSSERPGPTFVRMSPLDESAVSALAHKDHTQYLRITKMALRQYLQECLGQNGQFRKFFDLVAPATIGYHVNQNLAADPNERHLQIAIYYEGMTQRPPQIFIQDGGYTYSPDSLGSLCSGWNQQTKDGHQIVHVMDVVPIPIDITCVALDQQEVEDLAAYLAAALGQMQRFTINYILRPPEVQNGAYWEVRIPFQHTISAKTHSPVMSGEPRQQIWQITCSLTIEFENSTYFQYRSQPLFSPQRSTLQLSVPSMLRLGQEHRVTLLYHAKLVAVYSDDARIAVVQRRGLEWIIEPRRVGTFNLIVSRVAGTQEGPEIYTQQAIEVRAR